jgi:hypothetical protein
MRAAVQALRTAGPPRIVVAVPAAPDSTCREMVAMVDEMFMRERRPGDCRLAGFSTYTGTVTAGDEWRRPAGRKWVHVDEMRAVEPPERTAGCEEGEAPETYPFAL